MSVRRAAVAGSWYPGTAPALRAAVDACFAAADEGPPEDLGRVAALVAPHAGIRYSGRIAAAAYRLLRADAYDVAVLVGPSHFMAFEGAAVYAAGGFETPFGVVAVDEACARELTRAPVVRELPAPHRREHSLELQLPFLQRAAPGLPIVPLLMGVQTAAAARELAEALAAVLGGRRALLVASTDLSHYHDAAAAGRLDRVIVDAVGRFDAEALEEALARNPGHACGGGPLLAVLRASRLLGASRASVVAYGDSGDVTGDKTAVVGYMAAAIGDGP